MAGNLKSTQVKSNHKVLSVRAFVYLGLIVFFSNRHQLLVLLLLSTAAFAQPRQIAPGTVLPTRDVPAHDPVMIKEKDTYYLFCTGWGISVWSSKDMQNWRRESPVFRKPPQWAVDTIPNFKGHIWAPDISYHNSRYYLYYSVSLFGKNTSAIGVATAKTLDSTSTDFGWIDHGPVVQSYPGETPWNAIDPAVVADEKGTPYMAFGSFWTGLQLVQLTPNRLHLAAPGVKTRTIASRTKANPQPVTTNPPDAGNNAIEAPFIFKKGPWYYLFASIDYCCRGENSTYKMIMGRSKKIEGPYRDKKGNDLRNGGGTVLLQGNKQWHGVGHNAVYTWGEKDYLIYHGYDAADKGASKLRIAVLTLDEQGWPFVQQE